MFERRIGAAAAVLFSESRPSLGPIAGGARAGIVAAALMALLGGGAAAGAEQKLALAGQSTAVTLKADLPKSDLPKANPPKSEEITRLVRAQGVVGADLYESGIAAGVPDKIMTDVARMMGLVADLQRDLRQSDSYEVLYEVKIPHAGAEPVIGEIVYAGLNLSGKRYGVWRFTTPDGVTDYFDAEGKSLRTGLLRTPVDGARISSKFGMRKHPILGFTRMHKGLDFAAPEGTPVYAAGDGEVVEAGRRGTFGNYILIRHEDGYSTAYAHLAKIEDGIEAGAMVKQGQEIATVGTTGLSTGPHLHYEVHLNDEPIDPATVEGKPRIVLTGKVLEAFHWAAAMTKLRPAVQVGELTKTPAKSD
jgi:murein DD-endopeptidase MepM/ murein hydrolase activator NlpD